MKLLQSLLMAAALCLAFIPSPSHAADDSKLKTWLTAELLGAMRWAKAETDESKKKLEFSAAEIVCYKRLQKQIDAGLVSKTSAFILAENVRKKGVYRGDELTLEKAEELRKIVITGRFFEKLKD